jgi:hypothetical protein
LRKKLLIRIALTANMAKQIIHVSEAEAASNLRGLLAQVRSGAEVIIEHNTQPIAVLRIADPHVRFLSESLSLAKAHASNVTLDADFSRDLNQAIDSHRDPLNPPLWD